MIRIFTVVVGLTIAIGAPAVSFGVQEPIRLVAFKHDWRVPELPGSALGSVPTARRKDPVPQTPSAPEPLAPVCEWRWRDLEQGSGQVYACE